jgi:hypothetical protein
MVKRVPWLSVTPEPERELPAAVATLACGGHPTDEAVAAQKARIEHLVLHGSQRRWHVYLHEVVELIERRRDDPDPEVADAAWLATQVIANHHNLLLALPGGGAKRTERDRRRLAELLATRNEDPR